MLIVLLLSACTSQEGAPVEHATATGSEPGILHALQGRDRCLTCHVVGSGGVGEPGGTGMPVSHEGRPAGMCRDCHSPR